jgi:hypothetical protein
MTCEGCPYNRESPYERFKWFVMFVAFCVILLALVRQPWKYIKTPVHQKIEYYNPQPIDKKTIVEELEGRK